MAVQDDPAALRGVVPRNCSRVSFGRTRDSASNGVTDLPQPRRSLPLGKQAYNGTKRVTQRAASRTCFTLDGASSWSPIVGVEEAEIAGGVTITKFDRSHFPRSPMSGMVRLRTFRGSRPSTRNTSRHYSQLQRECWRPEESWGLALTCHRRPSELTIPSDDHYKGR